MALGRRMLVLAVVLVSVSLFGCGGGDPTPTPTPAPSPEPAPTPPSIRWAFGSKKIIRWDGTTNKTFDISGKVTWAVEVPGKGLALCDEERSILSVFDFDTMNFTDVPLAPLSSPVGAVFFENKVWVAAFGNGGGMPGLAVVDPFQGTLDAHYPYPRPGGAEVFVHNVYVMDWDGQPEIFAVSIGNPWSTPPVLGNGLVLFNRTTNTFLTDTTSDGIHARSAVQQVDGSVFVLAQQPPGTPSRLVRLVRSGGQFEIAGEEFLPTRGGGDGGADVFFGPSPNSVFVTDRTAGLGKLYHYTFNTTDNFTLVATKETGNNPRYTTALGDGDIVACNQNDGTLSTFTGLAQDPTANIEAVVTEAVPEVSFFLTTQVANVAILT